MADAQKLEIPDTTPAISPATAIFYFGSGTIDTISSGLDRVTALHWRQLETSGLRVEGFIVSPDATTLTSRQKGLYRLRIYPRTSCDARGSLDRWRQRLGHLLKPNALLLGASLHSRRIARDLAKVLHDVTPSVVIIDHFYSLQNIPLFWLLAYRGPLVYIAHDQMPALVSDLQSTQKPKRPRIAYLIDLIKARIAERLLMRRADRLVFLSRFDAAHYPEAAARTSVLLPFDDRPDTTDRRSLPSGLPARYVVFLGSPSYSPNAEAIDWLRADLAPALHDVDPTCTILLVGKRTEAFRSDAGNLKGLGYVSDEDLAAIVVHSVALLSPIRHGSGLKIKIMDALALGCPVIATEHALRGFEDFAIDHVIRLDDPIGCARMIRDLADHPADRAATSARLLHQSRRIASAHAQDFIALLRHVIGARG